MDGIYGAGANGTGTLTKALTVTADYMHGGGTKVLPAGELVTFSLIHSDVYGIGDERFGLWASAKATELVKALSETDAAVVVVQCATCGGGGVRGRSGGACKRCGGTGGWPGSVPVSRRKA